MSEQLMCMPKAKKVTKSNLLSKTEVTELVQGIYVGYNPAYTLETAVASASKRMMNQLNMNLSHGEVMNLVANMSVISSGGLDNYFYKIYQKLADYNQKLVA
jgi:hypothetical protein